MSMVAKLNPFHKKVSLPIHQESTGKVNPIKNVTLSPKPVLKDITREQSFWDNGVLS